MKGVSIELMSMLDNAREIANIPFVITSGLRSIAENTDVGGVSDSAHLAGLAVDLRCRSSQERFIMTYALLDAGFKRIELKPDHIHVDIDKTKEQGIMWL